MEFQKDVFEELAATTLRDAGFPLVQREVGPPGTGGNSRLVADVVAWDVGEEGTLRAEVLVEVKRGFHKLQDKAPSRARPVLRQLSAYANALGTRQVFVMDESGWYRASPSFDSFAPSNPPEPSGRTTSKPPPDDVVRQLVLSKVRRTRNEVLHSGNALSLDLVLERVLNDLNTAPSPSAPTSSPQGTPARGSAAVRTLFESVFPLLTPRSDYVTPWAIAEALARLASPRIGSTVWDPQCGLGACLLALADQQPGVSLTGTALNPNRADWTRQLGALAGLDIAVEHDDSLLGLSARKVDVLVSDPPMARRLPTPVPLGAAGTTKDATLALLDRLYEWLRPAGRAVLVLTPHALFAGGPGERVRASIQSNMRVSALISLPNGVFHPFTPIAPVLAVFDKVPPGPTLVARLGKDWQEQLGPSGDFLAAFREQCPRSE